MRNALLSLGALALSLSLVAPALAQVGVELDGPGVGVRIGEPERRYEERRRVRVYEDNRSECRTVTVRRERWDGSIETRRERRCD